MKKISITVIISLVMCLTMAFPASAATITNTSLSAKYDPYIAYLMSCRPVGYDYYIVNIAQPSVGSAGASHDLVQIYYFKTAIVPSTSTEYYRNLHTFYNGSTAPVPYLINNAIFLKTYNGNQCLSVNDSNSVLSYYAADRSTAKFYNHDTMENGEWKTKNWQLNMGANFRSELLSLLYVARSKQDVGYSATTWQALQDAITAAMELFATLNYTTTQVDNAKIILQNALDGLSLPVDISSLQTLITIAKAKQNTSYSATSWQTLQNAITAAESLLATAVYTQTQVDNAKAILQNALDALRLLPDASALQALIKQAEEIQNDGYTDYSYNHLVNMVISATGLLSGKNYDATQIENEYAKLQSAVMGLEKLPQTSELATLIAESETITDIGYTSESWERFISALVSARSLLASGVYTQAQINNAVSELQLAINALALIPVTPPVTPDDNINYDAYGWYKIPSNAAKYTDIADGVQPKHLETAKQAFVENISVTRKYGLWVYLITVLPVILVIIVRKFIGDLSSPYSLDITPSSAGGKSLSVKKWRDKRETVWKGGGRK